MPTLSIEGRKVTVDDSFLKLAPEDQQATVDEIAAHFAPAAPDIGTNRASTIAALRGIPIAGAYVDKGAAMLNAAAQPFTDTGLSHAPTYDERLAENEKMIQAATDQFERQNPIGTAVGKVTLGSAALLPATAAAPGLMGAAGGLGARMLAGGVSNAAIGGVDAAARGQDISSGAALAGIAGAGMPVALKAAGAVASPFISNIMARVNPEAYGARQVARGIVESGRPTADIANDVVSAAREGQGVFTVGDAMGNSGQRLLSTVARAPGEGRTDVVNTMEGRQGTQGRRISNALAEGFNAPETAAQTEARLTGARDTAANAEYGQVRTDAQQVDLVPAINHLDSVIGTQPGQTLTPANDSIEAVLTPFRQRLARVNPDDFEAVQRIRGDMADAAQNAMQSGYGNRARLIGGAVRRLDAAMENASQGYLQANRNFAQASRNIEAVQTGREAATRGRTEDTIPAFQALQPEGQQAYRSGYVDPLIAKAQGDPFGTNKARPLINDAFQAEANAMAPGNPLMQRRIGREQTMFETRATALGGSKTADNLADADALGIDPSVVGHVISGNWGGAVRGLISSGKNAFNGNTPQVRKAIADILLRHGASVTPADLDRLVGQTVRQIQMVQQLARTSARVASGAVAVAPQRKRNPSIFAKAK